MDSSNADRPEPRPRVTFLAGNLYPLLASSEIPIVGGAEVQQLLLARELRASGHDLDFVVEDLGQGPRVIADGWTVHGYAYGRNKARQAGSLWRALRAADPDVIYLRGVPRFLSLVLAFRRVRRCALVLGLSTNRQVYPRVEAGRGRWDDLVFRRALRDAEAVVVQSRFQAEALRRHFGRATTELIRNGTTPPAADPSPEERGSVVWIGSLHPYKGIERLFELAASLPELTFEVVGGPARNEEAFYERAAERARAFPNLRWHGFRPHDRVDEVLRRALALVNTTLPLRGVSNLEGFPNVYLEAWRNGVPTFTLENDPDDLIATQGLGRRCRDLGEMGRELRRLAGDLAAQARFAEAVRRQVRSEHDIGRAARRYADLFARVAPRRRP